MKDMSTDLLQMAHRQTQALNPQATLNQSQVRYSDLKRLSSFHLSKQRTTVSLCVVQGTRVS
jgi:hypothetical protein